MEIRTETVNLATADGKMPAHLCRPTVPGPHPAVIVVMEAFGLNGHIEDVAERIAREGYVTMAPDLYYRFGSPIIPYTEIPKAIDTLKKLEDAKVMAEIGAVIAHLKGLKEVRAHRIGRGGIAADAPNAPLNFADKIRCPILCFFGETDAMIPLDQVKKVEDTLKRLGKTFEVKVYKAAGHGFFCNERASYHPDSPTPRLGFA